MRAKIFYEFFPLYLIIFAWLEKEKGVPVLNDGSPNWNNKRW